MQQTEKYQLNLIESSDTFSPAPLNENMEKVEGALAALQTAVDGKAPASLEGRVAVLEAKKMVIGTYVGDQDINGPYAYVPQFIDLGFTPTVVILRIVPITIAFQGAPGESITIVDGGFRVTNSNNSSGLANSKGRTYYFIAFG